MTTPITTRTHLQPLLSTPARIATAVAVAAVVAVAWVSAAHESHQATQAMSVALNRNAPVASTVTRVTLPRVDVVGSRDDARAAPVANAGPRMTAL